MRKIILDEILERMKQTGSLEGIESKKENENAFELDGIRYKRSDLYPLILNIPNPANELDTDVDCWAGMNMNHIETGEREVPVEYLKTAWKRAWGLEPKYENKHGNDKTVNLSNYISDHDMELRKEFRKLVPAVIFHTDDKRYDAYTALQWLVWLLIVEEKGHFPLCRPKSAANKYNVELDSYNILDEKISMQMKNAENILILYGKQFSGKTVFARSRMAGMAAGGSCYYFDCGQKSFIQFLNGLRNRQDDFWLNWQAEDDGKQIVLPYNIEEIGEKQNLARLMGIEAGDVVVWDNIAGCDLDNYIDGISGSGFHFKSVLIVDAAVIDQRVIEKMQGDVMAYYPGLSDQEMKLVADSVFLKAGGELKNGMACLAQEDKRYLENLIPDLNGNAALLELVVRNYLALRKGQGQEEACRFLKHMQEYKDMSPADRKTARFKATGTTSSFDNNIRYVFQQSISSGERLKITILSLLNGRRVRKLSLQKYFKIYRDDLDRFLEDGMVEEDGGFVTVRIHPVIPEMLFPFLRKNNASIEGNYSNEELKECLEYIIRLIGDLMKLSPQPADEKELAIIVDAVAKRIYLMLCENECWFMNHFDMYFTFMMKYKMFLLEYDYFGSYDDFRLRMDDRSFRINGRYYDGGHDVYEKELTDIKKGMFHMLDWQRMYKEVQAGHIYEGIRYNEEQLLHAEKEIREAGRQIGAEIDYLMRSIKDLASLESGKSMPDRQQFGYDMYNLAGMLEPIIKQKLDGYFTAMYWYFNNRDEKRYGMCKDNFITYVQKFLDIKNEYLLELKKSIQRVYGHALGILKMEGGHIQIYTLKVEKSLSIKDKTDAVQAICLQYLSLECACQYQREDWMNSFGTLQELYVNLIDWLEVVIIKDISLNFLIGIVNDHFKKLLEYVKSL